MRPPRCGYFSCTAPFMSVTISVPPAWKRMSGSVLPDSTLIVTVTSGAGLRPPWPAVCAMSRAIVSGLMSEESNDGFLSLFLIV